MTVGTKSLLFGVHQFIWHPIVVCRAWRMLHGRWPRWFEMIAIFFHDWGYFGCRDMDGPEGVYHPRLGANIASRIVWLLSGDLGKTEYILELCAGHSSSYANVVGLPVSALCGPDKCSILFEPWWFYRLRASLSGELDEYVRNGPGGMTPRQWFKWLQRKFRNIYEAPQGD